MWLKPEHASLDRREIGILQKCVKFTFNNKRRGSVPVILCAHILFIGSVSNLLATILEEFLRALTLHGVHGSAEFRCVDVQGQPFVVQAHPVLEY